MSIQRPVIVALICALIASAATPARGEGSIVIAAEETVAVVDPSPADQLLVNLPALEFALQATVQCAGEPVSVTLSVADTFATVRDEALQNDESAEVLLEVPARQTALAATSHFCKLDDPDSSDELEIDGFVTANASLFCVTQESTSVHYARTPLQLRLRCQRDAGDEDQPPAESTGEAR